MTAAELAEKRAKGICFRCDGKFSPGHRCPNKSLQVLILGDVDEDEDEPEGKEEHPHLETIEVSLNSVSGLTSPRTMKLRVELHGAPVVVLIGNGATHSFISKKVIEKLGMEVKDTGSVGVTLGNGRYDRSRGTCKAIVLSLAESQVVEDFFPLDLGGSDLILGMSCLQTLGDMIVN